jgi:acyl-CoA oxidase
MESFVNKCEKGLCAALVADETPKLAATRAIAVAKIRAVETCVELCHRLKQEVGSYALMADTGFEHTDFLQCCKFAEGDSRVLMMKVARDRVRWFAGLEARGRPAPAWLAGREEEALAKLARRIEREKRAGRGGAAAWEAAWEEAYALAAVAVDAIVDRWVGGVEKFRGTNTSRSVPASRL